MKKMCKKAFACVMVLALLLSSCMGALAQEQAFEWTIDWDAEYDVIVVGFGGAGATAAITAVDAGAKVLVLEKAPKGQEGGNTRYAGQVALHILEEEKDAAIGYLKSIRGAYSTPDDATITAFVENTITSAQWFNEHGGNAVIADGELSLVGEHPEFAGWEAMHCWVGGGEYFTGKFYNPLHDWVVSNDSADVWYDAPAKHLIQDRETGIIHGVIAEVDGQEYKIRAKNGVILCCGGFENNERMIEDYLDWPAGYSRGARYNTGDGIVMAMEVGADLWHMANVAGPDLNVINRDTNMSFGNRIQGVPGGATSGFSSGSVIFVGPDGTRFTDEATMPNHGYVNYHGTKINGPLPYPAYAIFDSQALGRTIYAGWSEDKQAEIDAGYIVKADTLEELANKMGITADGLSKTVAQYNAMCDAGEDIFFGRPAEYLIPLAGEGPYYAMMLEPTMMSTLGGPRRNAEGQVMGLDGEPIPHLYSAGELGSIFAYLYQGCGALGECIAYGRISGGNAAIVKADVTQESVMNGKEAVSFIAVEETIELAENQRLGTASGIAPDLKVIVTLQGDKIEDVTVYSHNETPGICDRALEEIPKAIVAVQSADVDAVSGATLTSNGIMQAVRSALEQ